MCIRDSRHPLYGELIANFQAGLRADVEHDLASVHSGDQPFNRNRAGFQLGVVGHQFTAHLGDRRVHGLADNRLLEIAAAEVHGATAPTVPIAAAAQQRGALAGGLTLARGYAHDFRRVDVHQTRVHNDHGLALLVAEATKTISVSYTHLRAHETVLDLVCR